MKMTFCSYSDTWKLLTGAKSEGTGGDRFTLRVIIKVAFEGRVVLLPSRQSTDGEITT